MEEHKLSFDALNIAPAEIYEAMGYGTAEPDGQVRNEVERMLARVRAVTHPLYAYFITDGLLVVEQERLEVCGTSFDIGSIIARQLRGSQAFAFFVATAGQAFEELQHTLKEEGDMVAIYMADSLGSIIAEKAADRMEEALQRELDSRGWKHTNRYSPGYCGWHVSQQKRLFPLFPTERPCGITLTDSSLMLPIKSVSGVIGVGESVRHMDYTCGLCDFEQCFRRKKK